MTDENQSAIMMNIYGKRQFEVVTKKFKIFLKLTFPQSHLQ